MTHRLAMVESDDAAVTALLKDTGWTVVDPATADLSRIRDAGRVDLFIGEVRGESLSADIRRLTTLHALAPDLSMVIVTERLGAGDDHLPDGVMDVPVVRRGCSQGLLAAAIAAAR
jgi:hypothetical protein